MAKEPLICDFGQATSARVREQTAADYARAFGRFAKDVGLQNHTRRQLAGRMGKKLLLSHLGSVSKASRRWTVAALRLVWMKGLGLSWPIETKDDLGKLPRIGRRESPDDSLVRSWKSVLALEPDLYLRLIWLLVGQHGWRPSHVRKLKWRNVRYDKDGKPVSMYADGSREKFKTCSPIVAALCPEVSEALAAWRQSNEMKQATSDSPIVPWRNAKGEIEVTKPHNRNSFAVLWQRLQRKWGLQRLRPVDLRHWVATACRKAGLSKQATAALMGHDPVPGMASMPDWYDSPQAKDFLKEQERVLPRGALGLLDPPVVELVDGLPEEAVSLLAAYWGHTIGTLEFANRIEAMRLRATTLLPKPDA